VVAFRKRAGMIWSVSTFSNGRGTQVLSIMSNFCFIVVDFLGGGSEISEFSEISELSEKSEFSEISELSEKSGLSVFSE
jgi:hypothetical protein